MYECDNDNLDEDGAWGGAALDEREFNVPTPQQRHQNWISPRLCSALDKAKVKRMRLKK